MSQVIQAKCPHCSNVLRIPADWLGKAMRCKHCKNTFQAKVKSAPAAPIAAGVKAGVPVAKANKSVPVAQPANAVPAAAIAAAAPPRQAANAPFGFPEEETTPLPSVAKPRKKGRGMLLLVLAFFFLFVLGAAGAGVVVYKVVNTGPPRPEAKEIAKVDDRSQSRNPPVVEPTDGRKDGKVSVPVKKDDSAPKTDGPKKVFPPKKDPVKDLLKKDAFKKDMIAKDGGKKPPAPPIFTNDPFPRRALLISVNNYLMFSTVHYGSAQDNFKGGYPGSSTAVLRDRLTRPPMYFPTSQVTELSDGIPDTVRTAKAHPTQKSVIETTIKDFVDTCRDQDRVVVFFAGHATSLEDKSYLIPIDGNLKEADSLIPLKWVYDQLARCKAQQKVLILDTFRYSPARGFELPSAGEGEEGTMPEAFDKDLQNPPAGVQVWCSCQKEQSAIELEAGSAFMQALCHSLQGTADMVGISAPTQPIPIDALLTRVNQRLKDLVTPEKKTQVSRLTGKANEGVAFDAKEPLPPAVALKQPTVGGAAAAGFEEIDSILSELLQLAPVRETRAGEAGLLKARNLPAFSVKKLDAYKRDGYGSINELMGRWSANKEAYAKEFPLRAAVFEAIAALQESSKVSMREVLPGPINPKTKAAFLLEQSGPGISIFKLEGVLAQLKAAGEERDKETSKRWQANFDYTLARMQSRLVYLFEYSYTLGQIRADNLPELAPGQNGWRIGTGKKIAVTESKAKAYFKDTTKLWKKIQDQNPGTPWAMLAQRESMISIGLQWRPKSD